jgi:hypothetical protein
MNIQVNGKKVYIKKDYSSNSKGLQVIKDMRYFGIEFKKGSKKDSKKKELNSILKTRKRIKTILECNVDEKTWFITLTFAENIQDYDKANRYFKKYLEKNFPNLKYMNCKELQLRGAIHYHLIVFDYQEDLKQVKKDFKKWQHGIVFVKKVSYNNYQAMANYFSGYMGKENQLIAKNKKIFTTSRNLKKPKKYNHLVYDYLIKKYGWNIDFQNIPEDLEKINLIELTKTLFGIDKVKII